MKKIICYGDSNTFGFNPKNASRYDENNRWTGILQKQLEGKYEIIEEGCCDRTGFAINSKGDLYSAQLHFPSVLSNIEANDILIIAIGTNDLQFLYSITNDEIKAGLEKLIDLAQTKTKSIIVIPPVVLNKKILDGYFKCQFDEKSIIKSQEVQKVYEQTAKEKHCLLFDINTFAKPSDWDGLHYDRPEHKLIAEMLLNMLVKI